MKLLKSWDLEEFRDHAFDTAIPAILPASSRDIPAACSKWFLNNDSYETQELNEPVPTKLNEVFWRSYTRCIVPLEITTTTSGIEPTTTFERVDAPLEYLLRSMEPRVETNESSQSIYLAQHDLRDLPQALQDDLPTPNLVLHAGKGDIYSSSLWLGRSPTYTPLHKDPNPNLFMQLAGGKAIRLFRPEVGLAIFELVQKVLRRADANGTASDRASFAALRGEEMMQGSERTVLHDLVWSSRADTILNGTILTHAYDAKLGPGDALFIPKGWWHSVKGLGEGLTASANWWFR